jgi:hypothetical protein
MIKVFHALWAGGLWLASALLTPCLGQENPATATQEAVIQEDPVTPEIATSAVAAVARLGEEVVLGRYQAAIDLMNPEWKERAARRYGGMEQLEQRIAKIPAEMVRQGISMISFKPQGPPRVLQIAPGRKITAVGETVGHTKWLVFVPTATRYRILSREQGGPPRSHTIERTGFQAAISRKDHLDWTFIDGSGLKVSDLRQLFPTLPLDLQLPAVSEREIR